MANDITALGPSAVRDYARRHTLTALRTLVNICQNPRAKDQARIAAANSLLDRGWGRPIQSLSYDNPEEATLLTVFASSFDSATKALGGQMMIEAVVDEETVEDVINKPSRTRPKLRNNND